MATSGGSAARTYSITQEEVEPVSTPHSPGPLARVIQLRPQTRTDAATTVDAEIWMGLAAGDPAALELAYDRYSSLSYGLALRVLGDPGRAEEVVQDVFLTLWKRPGSYNPERGSFRTWLTTLVRNRAIDSRRGSWRHQRGELELPVQLPDLADSRDPALVLETGLRRDMIRDGMDALPEEQKQAIDLAYFGGLTHTEISDRLGIPLGTIKGRLRLGMEKLHSYLLAKGVSSR